MYSMRRLPQANDVNPAFQPLSNFFFNLPLISSTYASINNSGFSFQDYNNRGSLRDVSDQLWDYNSLKIRIGTDILRFGGRVFDTYHTFNISLRSKTFFSYPDDFGKLIAYGNYDYDKNIARSYDLSQLKLLNLNYLEIGYTYSNRVDKRLCLGYKVKFLNGISVANIDFEETEVKTLSTNQTPIKGTEYNLKIKGELAGFPNYYEIEKQTSAIDTIAPDVEVKDKKYDNYVSSMLRGNFGLGLDFGFTYKIKENIEVSASIIDFGAIYWNNLSQTIEAESDITWSGIKIPNDLSLDNVNFNKMLNENFEDVNFSSKEESFFTILPFDMNFSIEYQKNKDLQYGSILKLMYFNKTIQPQMSFYGTFTLLKSLSMTTNYTIKNHSLSNLGVGLDLKLGFAQIYFLTDNILATFAPERARSIGAHFGVNFIFRSYEPSLEEKLTDFDSDF
jgi:hypothetical protein